MAAVHGVRADENSIKQAVRADGTLATEVRFSSSGRSKEEGEKYTVADLEVYRKALWVGDEGVRSATFSALTHYPEGFGLLCAFLKARAEEQNAPYAVVIMRAFSNAPNYQVELKKVLAEVNVPTEAKDGSTSRYRRGLVIQELTRSLFQVNPAEHGDGMVEAIKAQMLRDGRDKDISEVLAKEIAAVAKATDKKKLYPIVPELIDSLNAFFDSSRANAYELLVLITGEKYPFDPRGNPLDRRETAEKYRELYYTKLKHSS